MVRRERRAPGKRRDLAKYREKAKTHPLRLCKADRVLRYEAQAIQRRLGNSWEDSLTITKALQVADQTHKQLLQAAGQASIDQG